MSRAFRIGILVLAALGTLAGGIFLIGEKHFLFRRTYRLDAEFQNVAGLNNGAEVRVGGIHLGTVKYISLPHGPNGKLDVVMEMAESTRPLIRQDSVARIKTEGLLGNQYVEVTFGGEKSPEIQPGDVLKGEPPVDYSEAALAAINRARDAAAAFEDDADALKHNFLLRGFFKRRGYEDERDLAKNRISALPRAATTKEFVFDAKNLFASDTEAKLKNEKPLAEAGRFLEENKFSLAVVAASQDTGDTDQDRRLTRARAKVVRDYLARNFRFDDTRVKILGLGKTDKLGDASRVEILIYD